MHPAQLVFTKTNYAFSQFVNVTAVDDAATENSAYDSHDGFPVVHSADSTDPVYSAGVAVFTPCQSIKTTIFDNDPAVSLSRQSMSVEEGGGNETYTVVLNAIPTSDVFVDVFAPSDIVPIEGLTFTVENWNVPQTVVVAAVDDGFDEEEFEVHTLVHAVRSEDLRGANDVAFWFRGASTFLSEGLVQVTVRDDDLDHGFVVSETKISVVEGQQTATFEIALKSEPFVVTEEGEEISVGITIILTTLKGELLLSAPVLHFDSENWSGPQTVEVGGGSSGLSLHAGGEAALFSFEIREDVDVVLSAGGLLSNQQTRQLFGSESGSQCGTGIGGRGGCPPASVVVFTADGARSGPRCGHHGSIQRLGPS